MQHAPIGVPGELYISGVGLARGYLNRAELTAERFIPDPFSNEPGARMYKTGDLGRYLADGNLEFLGRIDSQVKLRGYRIELGESEAVLMGYPTVRESIVLVRENASGDKRLIAYVIPHAPEALSITDLRSYLRAKLPEYLVPSAFVLLEAWPLTSNGKVDRRALPNPEELPLQLQSAYVAPQSQLERTVATVWQEVLHLEKIGIHDNFFDVGGHSLLLTQLQNKLQEVLNRDLSILDLFKYPTISSLAEYLGQEQSAHSSFKQNRARAENRRGLLQQHKNARQQLSSQVKQRRRPG
jgi:acyl carrier protein